MAGRCQLDGQAGPVVLLADDDGSIRAALAEALSASGFVVREARSGIEALALFAIERPDAVVSDVSMPNGNGFEVLEKVVASSVPRIPVILVSGQTHPGDRERAISRGAVAYLTKPVGLQELVGILSTALGKGASLHFSPDPYCGGR